MKNFVSPGKTITATAPYDVAAGGGCKIGGMICIATSAVLNGKVGEFDLVGVFDVTKATGAWTEGALIYWDDIAKAFTTTSSANTKAGVAVLMDSAGTLPQSADATGRIRLNGAF